MASTPALSPGGPGSLRFGLVEQLKELKACMPLREDQVRTQW